MLIASGGITLNSATSNYDFKFRMLYCNHLIDASNAQYTPNARYRGKIYTVTDAGKFLCRTKRLKSNHLPKRAMIRCHLLLIGAILHGG